MPLVAVFQSPSLTQETYGASVSELTGGARNRMESAADWGVDGLLVHIAGGAGSDFRVVDVWESEDAFRAFGAILMPILARAGVEVVPDVFWSHAFVSP